MSSASRSVRTTRRAKDVTVEGHAEAELAPPVALSDGLGSGEYAGPLAYRQGTPMRPDVPAPT